MEDIRVLEELFDQKVIRILKTLLQDGARKYYLQELADNSQVPIATTSRILARLEKAQVIEVEKISRFKLYRLADNQRVKLLSGLFKEDQKILQIFAQEAARIPGIDMIIQHGKETQDRAGVIIIGENIDTGTLKSLIADIREKYKFSIISTTHSKEHYNEVAQMGMYPRTKKVLYEREGK